MCYAAAVRDATKRRIDKKYEKANPDLSGFLPTDGVSISVDLVDQPTEDVLGLDPDEDSLLGTADP